MAHVESDLRDELARKQRITLNQRVETLNKYLSQIYLIINARSLSIF